MSEPPQLPRAARSAEATVASAATARLERAIDALLPQTQCTRCGFDGCLPYARAIAGQEAPINRCPPGGGAGIARLAALLGQPALPLDPECGAESPRRLAWIDPVLCIGCTKCIQACPVDAIIGGQRRMHTVVARACTGCELCVAPCPVDCIVMQTPPAGLQGWSDADADDARRRHRARRARLARLQAQREARLAALAAADRQRDERAQQARSAVIEAAMRRARERLAQRPDRPRPR